MVERLAQTTKSRPGVASNAIMYFIDLGVNALISNAQECKLQRYNLFCLRLECGLGRGDNDDLRTHCLGCRRIFTGHQTSIDVEPPDGYSRMVNSLGALVCEGTIAQIPSNTIPGVELKQALVEKTLPESGHTVSLDCVILLQIDLPVTPDQSPRNHRKKFIQPGAVQWDRKGYADIRHLKFA